MAGLIVFSRLTVITIRDKNFSQNVSSFPIFPFACSFMSSSSSFFVNVEGFVYIFVDGVRLFSELDFTAFSSGPLLLRGFHVQFQRAILFNISTS